MNRFYSWLANWSGAGQIIILENQDLKQIPRELLKPIEFVGDAGDEGHTGFYP